MDASGTLLPTLTSYLVQGPVLLVWLVGLILALVFWRRHPQVSLLAIIALLIFLAEALVGTYLNMWLPLILSERGVQAIALIFMIKGITTSVILAVAWALLVAAIFGWRASRRDASAAAQASPAMQASAQEPPRPGP